MSPRKWYIQYNDSVHGPFTSNQLRQMAERSQLTPDVKVRVGENGAWRSASSVKGLVINGAPTSDSMSTELSSEDIPISSDSDASASSELSSDIFEDDTPRPASSSSFGEMPSEAPPIPGEVPVRGAIPPHSEPPIPREVPPPHFSQIGEMPSPPPPIDGEDLGRSHTSSGHSKRKKRSHDAIPNLIQALISPDEQILYSAHPSFTVLLIQDGLTLMCYLFFGIIPSAIMMSNNNTDPGGTWLVFSTIALIIVLTIHYLRWIRSSYVITTE